MVEASFDLTSMNSIISISTFLAIMGAFLGGLVLLIVGYGTYYRYLALFVIGIGVNLFSDAAILFLEQSPAPWKSIGLIVEAFLPAFLLSFGSTLALAQGINLGLQARLGAWLLYSLAVIGGIGGWYGLFYEMNAVDLRMFFALPLTMWGAAYELVLVLGLTFSIMQLERVLWSLKDPALYRLKWILLGAASLAGIEVLRATHVMVLGKLTENVVVLTSIGTLFGLILTTAGLIRTRLRFTPSNIYVSPQVLGGSITLIVIGTYLIMVGIGSEWVKKAGGMYGSGLGYATIFVGLVTLLVLSHSRTLRLSAKTFVGRHFYQSRYDYRAKWREVTAAFQLTASVDSILDKLLEVISQTFGAGRVSIWVGLDADGSFHEVRTINNIKHLIAIPPDHTLLDQLRHSKAPLDIREVVNSDDPLLAEFQLTTNAALIVPLVTGEKLMAFVVLSENPRTADYTIDDKDLLHGIAHHAAVLLAHAALSEERTAGVELKALHQFSAFCLHDIKNLAARLSLVVQNAEVHGHHQAFQQSAMQTVERTVEKMTELISKLASASLKDETPTIVNINACIRETLQGMDEGAKGIHVGDVSEALMVRAGREQLHQVLLNLVLNARQATGGFEGIRVTACRTGDEVRIEVQDNGPGMRVEQLRTLFQPFKSTKSGGLGIGLYQCRKIVEGLEGRLLINSQVGKGTTALIILPLAGPKTVIAFSKGTRYGDR